MTDFYFIKDQEVFWYENSGANYRKREGSVVSDGPETGTHVPVLRKDGKRVRIQRSRLAKKMKF